MTAPIKLIREMCSALCPKCARGICSKIKAHIHLKNNKKHKCGNCGHTW